eukprot:gene12220-biopygen19934
MVLYLAPTPLPSPQSVPGIMSWCTAFVGRWPPWRTAGGMIPTTTLISVQCAGKWGGGGLAGVQCRPFWAEAVG